MREIQNKNLSAFSLIELIVVCTIIAVMAIVAVPNYSKYSKKTELNQKAEEVKGLMDLTRVSATNPDKDVVRYGVVFTAATGSTNASFTLNSYTALNGAATEIKKVEIPSGITIALVTPNSDKTFYLSDVPGEFACLYVTSSATACDKVSSLKASGDWITFASGSLTKTISIQNYTPYVH